MAAKNHTVSTLQRSSEFELGVGPVQRVYKNKRMQFSPVGFMSNILGKFSVYMF